MPHREATDYFQREYQAVQYYRKYGCDEAEVKRKIRDGEITIGEPPEKLGCVRRAPGGHFHYEYPDTPAPDKTEAQLRAEGKGPPRFMKIDDDWGDDDDPAVIAKSKLEAPVVAETPDTPVIAFLRSCTLDGLTLHVPSERIDPKVYAEAKKALLIFGGKWNTGKQCFSFKKDPAAHIATLIGAGKVVNEKKDRQAYYTPPDIVEMLMEYACITSMHDVLEPSAGDGAIALACVAAGAASVTVCELDPDECVKLRLTGKFESVLEGDFLTADIHKGNHPATFERIVMNPPFTKGQDATHILAAYEYLATGGRLIAIMADADSPKLAFLRPETLIHLPAGAFKASGTNVSTRIIQILK
jgi:16S rRNA G966 N2-methylase RsmD